MSLMAKDSGNTEYTPAPTGTHVARCISVIDLGTQLNERFGKRQAKIFISWELPDELLMTDDGEFPYTVSNWYTNSLHEKSNLRAHLEAWRGRAFTEKELEGFDVSKLLDKTCQLAIVHNKKDEKTYANIGAVMAMSKGQKCPARVNELVRFDLDDPDMEVLESLSDGLRGRIEGSDEWLARLVEDQVEARETTPAMDDDLPF